MSKPTHTFPLRLPASLKEAVETASREDGTSMNQFVVTAVAEKLAARCTAAFFAERRGRADDEAARQQKLEPQPVDRPRVNGYSHREAPCTTSRRCEAMPSELQDL